MSDETRKNLPAEARQLIAHARNDITIPNFGTVLQPQDDTLIQRGGGKGLKLYDEIERDPHAYALLQKRKLALIAREWEVEAASDDPRDEAARDFVEAVLSSLSFDRLCADLLDATLKGYAVAEIVWTRGALGIAPERIVSHDQRRFTFDVDWRPRLLTWTQPTEGEALPERKFIVHRFGAKGNNPFGLGLGTRLFWCVLFKREGLTFWLTFLSKFAMPTPVGKYPAGTLPEDQTRLLRTLQDMVASGAVVLPLGAEVSFLEASRAGRASYEEWCRYWDTQMSLAVFGSTLATHMEGQGSRAAAETHKEAEEQIIDADGDLLADTLHDQPIRWLVDLNHPGAGVPTVRRIRAKNEIAHEDLRKKRAENMKAELDQLLNLAIRVPPEHFAELAAALAGVDLMPQVPVEVLRKLAPHLAAARLNLIGAARAGQLPLPEDENDPKAEQVRQIAFAGDAGHDLASLADQLQDLAQPEIDAIIARARDTLAEGYAAGEDAGQMQERLLALFADADIAVDRMGRILGGALTLAELTGRAEVHARQKKR